MLQGEHLLGVGLPGEGVVAHARGGGEQDAVLQIGKGGLISSRVGERSGLAGVTGLQIPVFKPALQSVQIEFIPVCHQKYRPQQQGGSDQQSQHTK